MIRFPHLSSFVVTLEIKFPPDPRLLLTIIEMFSFPSPSLHKSENIKRKKITRLIENYIFTRLETKITIIENFNDYTKYFTDQCILIIVVRKNVQNNVQNKKKIWNVISKSEIPSPKYRRTLKNLDTTRRTIFLSTFLLLDMPNIIETLRLVRGMYNIYSYISIVSL